MEQRFYRRVEIISLPSDAIRRSYIKAGTLTTVHLEHIEPCPGNPMSLFDFYIMVDWSGAMRRRGMRADTIWTAYGGIEAENPKTDSPFSRTEAIHLIHSLLDEQSRKMLRVLLCFDFAYGFPRDFSAALQAATGKTDAALPWLAAWQYLSEAIKDDVGTVLHRKPTQSQQSLRRCKYDQFTVVAES